MKVDKVAEVEKVVMQYLDPLYGQLEFGKKELKLFQTEALTRLRDISLSAVPPLATPSGIIASRFEHSVGVAHLANKLTQRKEFSGYAVDLFLAGLFHDAGSPPFSHVSEAFLEDLTGENHEKFVVNVLEQKDVILAIKEYGGDHQKILKLITGSIKPLSDLINGTIDLDNIDNSLRWGLGSGIFQNKFYEPEHLIGAYVFDGRKLALNADYRVQIQKWELCRRLVYDLVYSDMNLGPGMMLFRALEFAYKEKDLNKDFFSLTESQALYILENRCNQKTRRLISDMRHWFFYEPAAKVSQVDKPSRAMSAICSSWKKRQKIADIVAKSLNIPEEEAVVYAGKDKGFKKIHLSFVAGEARQEHQPLQKECWRVKVYLHPKHAGKKKKAQKLVDSVFT